MGETRDPARTRGHLLNAAFEEIHRSGFRGASLGTILKKACVTKGALYHHFHSKEELGYAVLEELIHSRIAECWLDPLQETDHPIDFIIDKLRNPEPTHEMLEYGCPLANLAQEMSPLNDEFRIRVDAIYRKWREGLAEAIARGQKKGNVREEVDPCRTSILIMSSMIGGMTIGKNTQSLDIYKSSLDGLVDYLESLRPVAVPS